MKNLTRTTKQRKNAVFYYKYNALMAKSLDWCNINLKTNHFKKLLQNRMIIDDHTIDGELISAYFIRPNKLCVSKTCVSCFYHAHSWLHTFLHTSLVDTFIGFISFWLDDKTTQMIQILWREKVQRCSLIRNTSVTGPTECIKLKYNVIVTASQRCM